MNKINPLLEAMNNIDENIVSEVMSDTHKQPRRIKLIPIAASIAVLFTATAITAIATLKAPQQVTINDMAVEPTYKSYVDDEGREINMYIYDVPDFALGEEVEGGTPVGEIKVVKNPEYPSKWGEWMIVDEAGNKFYTGINNKLVQIEIKGGRIKCEQFGFGILNLLDGYGTLEIHSDSEDNSYEKVEFYFVPVEQYDELLKQKGCYIP